MGRGTSTVLLGALLLGCGSGSSPDAGGGGFGDASPPPVRDAGRDGTGAGHDAHVAPAADATMDQAVPGDAGACADAAALVDGSLSAAAQAHMCRFKCGPVTDPCTGFVTQCGGCTLVNMDGSVQREICDLPTNTCTTVKTTCAQLGAQCGTVINSCGDFLDCPDCPDGQQCDTSTNQCVPCVALSCADLGYQCGTAWLGCGPSSNTTDCGPCGAGQVCNTVFNLCEPACTPMSPAATCASAGAQCGVITDGCGGIVDCDSVAGLGCMAGQACGVAGEANQCDPPFTPAECVARGVQCGTLLSQCTGEPLQCGACPDGGECDDNGRCCTPTMLAATYGAKGQCGSGLPDGCGGTVDVSCSGADECVDNATGAPGMAAVPGTPGTCCHVPAGLCASTPADTCAVVANPCIPTSPISCSGCEAPKQCNGPQCCTPPPICAMRECNSTHASPDCDPAIVCACSPGLTCLCNGAPCAGSDAGAGICQCNTPSGNPYTCSTVPSDAGSSLGVCGTFDDGCGGSLMCSCPVDPNKPNIQCVHGGCACVPSTCDGQVGNGIPDGCGGTINCAG